MGFWSAVGEFAVGFMEGMETDRRRVHPSLREAWSAFDARGFLITEETPLALTGVKTGVFKDVAVQLRVLEDGSVEIDEGGMLGGITRVPRRPGAPTAAEHLASLEEPGGSTSSPNRSSPHITGTTVQAQADGHTLKIGLRQPAEAGVQWFLLLREEGRDSWLAGFGAFADEDGDFIAAVRSFPGERTLWCFLPTGAVATRPGMRLSARLVPTIGEEVAGDSIDFTLDGWAGSGRLDDLANAVPIVEVACYLGEAQGISLDTVFREVADNLDLRASQARELRGIWERPDRTTVTHVGRTLAVRQPLLTNEEVISSLISELTDYGTPSQKAKDIARAVAIGFGVARDEWDAALAGVTPSASGLTRSAALAVLELGPDAADSQIQAAYRRLMRDYHPDRVAHMPKGFQEYATQRAQELNAAYALLTEKGRAQG